MVNIAHLMINTKSKVTFSVLPNLTVLKAFSKCLVSNVIPRWPSALANETPPGKTCFSPHFTFLRYTKCSNVRVC